jgi:hypothetical protein
MTMETEDEQVWESDLSCTFCGPGTSATWEAVTDDGVVFACDSHHVEMSEKNLIRLERRMGKEQWKKIRNFKDFGVRQA